MAGGESPELAAEWLAARLIQQLESCGATGPLAEAISQIVGTD